MATLLEEVLGSEADVFWGLVYLGSTFDGCAASPVAEWPRTQLDQLRGLLQTHLPDLWAALERTGVQLSDFATCWLRSLFAHSLRSLCLVVWDRILATTTPDLLLHMTLEIIRLRRVVLTNAIENRLPLPDLIQLMQGLPQTLQQSEIVTLIQSSTSAVSSLS
eukprot:CAMPEP_0184686028 /NCGR_PEP_ID=MMETSP0312-20130426/21053_1 /TAXON_ID=31354 /ORGANISM="Compsopogon coeruleus, Strain SAG 36.94" /LENGTH=162 /DNA_ID=CAMNT_0027140707 /DNA_START=161 /DNA_END=649 /DNA_ORIENTATION=-